MAVLTDYLSRRGEYLVLIVVVGLSVALMALSSRGKDQVARTLSDGALTPVQGTIDRTFGLAGLRAENDSLRAQLARETLRVAELTERGREAAALRDLLRLRESMEPDVVVASIVGREARAPGREYKIDRGAADGVAVDLAVVTGAGLVGRVSRVNEHSAWVRPLVARDCRVSARIERTRAAGIVSWTRDAGLHLGFLPFRADVTVGDRVVSSGLGGVFPRGLAIGEVTRAEPIASEGTLRVQVRPVVDFSALEAVIVVGPDAARALAEAEAAAEAAADTAAVAAEVE